MISFRDFVIFRSKIATEIVLEEVASEAFKMFDQKGEGALTAEKFAKALHISVQLEQETASSLFKEIDTDAKGYLTQGKATLLDVYT